jgi:hypothetical protein
MYPPFVTFIGGVKLEQVITGGECFAEFQEKLHHYALDALLSNEHRLTDDEYDRAMCELAQAYINWYKYTFEEMTF